MGRVAIRLEVYMPFRGRRIWRGEEAVPEGTTVGALLKTLALPEPDPAVLVNGRHAPADAPLHNGDEVAILRQSDGG